MGHIKQNNSIQSFKNPPRYIVSVLGREEGYTPEGVPEGTPEGGGVYLTVYPESSPNADIVSF